MTTKETPGDEVGDALEALGGEVRGAIERAMDGLELGRRMRENPFPVLGVAAAAGFVLGGGLWPALRPFVRSAIRAALSPANLVAIAAAVGAMRAASGSEESPPEPEAQTH